MTSARERFRSHADFAKGYNDIIDSPRMVAAFDAAMMEFHSRIPIAPDMASAAANEWRRQGASQFLSILQNLNATPEARTPRQTGNLDHGR